MESADPSPAALQAALDAELPLQVAALAPYLRATAPCPLGDVDVEPSCPQLRQYLAARRQLAAAPGMAAELAAIGQAQLAHPAATVRLLAFQLATAEWSTHQGALRAALEAEVETKVQRAGLAFAFRAARAQGGLAALAAWTAARWPQWRRPGQELVRVVAMDELARVWTVDLPEDASRRDALCAAASAEGASDPEAHRAATCLVIAPACPQLAAARLASAALTAGEAEACATGLLAGWCQAPAYATANEEAYRALLAELARPPQAQRPAFALLQRLSCARPLAQADAALSPEARAWKRRVGFADVAALRRALVRLVEAEQAGGFARAEALRTARDLGVGDDQLGRWRRRWGQAEFGVEGQLRRALAP